MVRRIWWTAAAVACVLGLCPPAGSVQARPLLEVPVVEGAAVRPPGGADFVGFVWEGAGGGSVQLLRAGRWESFGLSDDLLADRGRFASPLVALAGVEALRVDLPAGARAARAVFISVPATATAQERACDVRRPAIETRGEWGADESRRQLGVTDPPAWWPAQKYIVHHSGELVPPPPPPDPGDELARERRWVRAIYLYHLDIGFSDIGYHFLIGPSGCIFEGRWSGDPVVPHQTLSALAAPIAGDGYFAQDASGRVIQGAHVFGFNRGTVGIGLLGNFNLTQPTPEALGALAELVGELAARHGIDPQGSSDYVDPQTGTVTRRDVPNVSGHRDWAATECPGNALYSRLGEVRQRAAEARQRAAPETTAEPVGVGAAAGTAFDNLAGIHHVTAWASPLGPVGIPQSGQAELSCDAPRQFCRWRYAPQGPGRYRVDAASTDRIGNPDPTPATAEVGGP